MTTLALKFSATVNIKNTHSGPRVSVHPHRSQNQAGPCGLSSEICSHRPGLQAGSFILAPRPVPADSGSRSPPCQAGSGGPRARLAFTNPDSRLTHPMSQGLLQRTCPWILPGGLPRLWMSWLQGSPCISQSVKTWRGSPSSNAQTESDAKQQTVKNQGNMAPSKEQNNEPVTDPKERRSMNFLTKNSKSSP
jgi:hypothetical protein